MENKINAEIVLARFQGDLGYNDICNQYFIDRTDFMVISKNFVNILLLNLIKMPSSDYLDLSDIVFNQKEKKALINCINLKTLNENEYLMKDAADFDRLINKQKTIETEKTIDAVFKINGNKLTIIKNVCSSAVILFLLERMLQQKLNSNGLIQYIREYKDEIKAGIELPFKVIETIKEKPKKNNDEFNERKINQRKIKLGFILFILFILFISWLLYIITNKRSFFWKL